MESKPNEAIPTQEQSESKNHDLSIPDKPQDESRDQQQAQPDSTGDAQGSSSEKGALDARVQDGTTKVDGQETAVNPSAAPEEADKAQIAASSLAESIVRQATPDSRTSTPPPGSTAPKKFSAVNATKKFLSKTAASPALPAPKPGATSRPSASPIPIASSSSRLLSTKLTNLSAKPASPAPPAAAPGPSSSPWAKPAAPLDPPDALGSKRSGVAAPDNVPMGSGRMLSGSARSAWKSVTPEARRPAGLARDFPTANEIAEGKKAKLRAAQAEAEHNEAILQGLNAFTQLDTTNRWDDEDDDDDVLDFGDGMLRPPPTGPVSKSERFAEDFDRSWPRQDPSQSSRDRVQTAGRGDRLLYNANSNQLETNSRGQPPPMRSTRLLTRNEPPERASTSDPIAGPAGMQPGTGSRSAAEVGGQHASSTPRQGQPRQPSFRDRVPSQTGVRPAWSNQGPPGLSGVPAPSRHAPEPQPQSQRPQAEEAPPASVDNVVPAPAQISADEQAAEMHTAAEKAKRRRLLEEAEREAAAERARRKAKELEEKYGRKPEAKPEVKLETKPEQPKTILPHPPAASATRPRQDGQQRTEKSWRKAASPKALPQEVNTEDADSKVEHNFDGMLARIQVAMAEARTIPATDAPVSIPEPLNDGVALYFDVTQPPLPPSPPPVWRTFTVRLPRPAAHRLPIKAPNSGSHSEPAPRDVASIMGFDPPAQVHRQTLLLADELLPQPPSRRFRPQGDVSPFVRMPTQVFRPFEKKKKRAVERFARSEEAMPMPTGELLESLEEHGGAASTSRWQGSEPAPEVHLKARSPGKSSATRTDRDGQASAGLAISHRGRPFANDAQPGVRFMVSSELDGDSLLQEVNKMSLETVGEGDAEGSAVAVSGAETPNTPPVGAQPGSPTGNSWSRTPVRGPSQHDHLRSVWNQPESRTQSAVTPSEPQYPSLNAPSPSDPAAASQALNYSHGHPFGTSSSSAFAMRNAQQQYPFIPEAAGQDPHQQQQHYPQAYQSRPPHQSAVWSASAFGTSMSSPGYGYTAKPSIDQKSSGKDLSASYTQGAGSYHAQYPHYPQSDRHGHFAGMPYNSQSARAASGRFSQGHADIHSQSGSDLRGYYPPGGQQQHPQASRTGNHQPRKMW